MKSLTLISCLLLAAGLLVAQDAGLLMGSYEDESGNRLTIGEDYFQFGDGERSKLVVGSQQEPGPSGGLVDYYIKPQFRSREGEASVVNIHFQSSDDSILAVYIFHYVRSENQLSVGAWDVLSGSYSHGVYDKVSSD